MEPRKKKVFKYFATRVGGGVVIRRTLGTLERVRSTLKVPRLTGSPRMLEDGRYNEGITFRQICITGGTIVGVIDLRIYAAKIGTVPTTDSVVKLTLTQKRAVKAILEIE